MTNSWNDFKMNPVFLVEPGHWARPNKLYIIVFLGYILGWNTRPQQGKEGW